LSDAGGARGGVVTSFDLNYREKLWKTQAAGESAQGAGAMSTMWIVVGNEEDLQKG